MTENKTILNGSLIALSETEDKTKLNGKFLICPLDELNLNGVGLKESDLTEEEKVGLIGQPLVGKVIKTTDGNYDFTGHNMKIKYEKDENGVLVKVYDFDTSPIGYHTSVSIEEIDFDGVLKKCIVANADIWKRYTNAIKALNRLIEKGEVKTSWEISFGDSYVENGGKWLKNITWLGNCVLGEHVNPAYPIAGLLEVAEENDDIQFMLAFTKDLKDIQELQQVENSTVDNIINNKQGGNIMPEETNKNKEVSSLTDNDIYSKLRKALNSIDENKWYGISRIYPYEFKAIAYDYSSDKQEDDYVEFTYVVNSDETISITSQKEVKMVFISKEAYESTISELNSKVQDLETKVSEKETEVSNKLDEIIKLGEDIKSKETIISEKDTLISELTPYKEKIQEIEKAEQEKEIAQKKENLKTIATKSGYISQEELETSEELKSAIDNLDESKIKGIIADRVVASVEEKTKNEVVTSQIDNKELERNLNAGNSNYNPIDVIKAFLNE